MRHVRTSSFATALAAALGLIASLVVSQSAIAGLPTVSTGSATVGVGQQGTVDVEVSDVGTPGLGAWTMNINYDPDVLSIVDCVANFGGICNENFDEDTVRLTGANANGLPGPVSLGRITFRCDRIGSSTLGLELRVLADSTLGDPQTIAATLHNGTVTCSPEPPPSESEKLPGDADCSGEVTSVDATWVLWLDAGLIDGVPCPEDADANHDGTIDALDAALILQRSAGLI